MKIIRNGAVVPLRLIRLTCLLLVSFCIAHFAISRFFLHTSSPFTHLLPSLGAQRASSFRPDLRSEIQDEHPIRSLMHDADNAFQDSNHDRSRTFKQAVDKYRRDYGRHPPAGFDKWYTFARERNIYNIDDFQQIHNDLRPFWTVRPIELRHYAAHASDDAEHGVATISIRNGKVFEGTCGAWRSGDFVNMLQGIASYLPDMDIPMNRMDQPRVVVPWEDLQEALKVEESTRTLAEDHIVNDFTQDMTGFWEGETDTSLLPTWLNHLNPFFVYQGDAKVQKTIAPRYGWFSHVNQPFTDLACQACPPGSNARDPGFPDRLQRAENDYTHPLGGFITNSNLSTDLCTVGPQLSHQHGLLYASTSMLVTQKLIPIFSECKMSVNNDILFPASIYYKQHKNYLYDDTQDMNWEDKDDLMFWRGSTSGGNAYLDSPDDWRSMHRQRLVLLTNSTEMADSSTSILALSQKEDTYNTQNAPLASFIANHTDIGFTKFIACLPNCSFYSETFSPRPWIPLSAAFRHKYLIDVDGHSFSGRWRAYLQSRSLALKATIMREWHDTRLKAWRHYVPVDVLYTDLYSLLTYFVGYSTQTAGEAVTVARHDYEAYRIATQGRDWAARVLRREDMEIYLLRLLLEYGRLIDDNRDRIGYVGDGGTEMERIDRLFPAVD